MRYHDIIAIEEASSHPQASGTPTLIRVHNSIKPIAVFHPSIRYPQQNTRKPNGLWWSFDSAWHSFVGTQRPKGKKVGAHNYKVQIDPEVCRLITLRSWDDILDFTIRFGNTAGPGGKFFWQSGQQNRYDPSQDTFLQNNNRCRVGQIAWGKVAEEFDGIELPTYQRRDPTRPQAEWLDLDWDVASGCAWSLKGVSLLEMEPG